MKTISQTLVALFALLCWTSASAQSNFGEFRWGLKAGANFASVNNLSNDVEKDKGKVGFVGGAFCKIPLKHYVSIRPELLFHTKGATLDIPTDVTGQRYTGRYATNYIELPLSIDFDLPFFLDLHVGVQGAVLLSKKLTVDGSAVKDPENFNSSEFGWHIGGGIDLGNIGIHLRFQQSLTSFYDTFLMGAGNVEPRNWGLALTASYMFVN
ncbi:MAG: PorT family protein [Saprospiraceae bacterium]|nr:PorT family protein [Saprospiraceae bacterium]